MTVLLSSHVLDEIERTVDSLVIIRDGKLITEGSIDSIVTGSGMILRVPAGREAAALAALAAAGLEAEHLESGAIAGETGARPGSAIAELLAGAEIYPDELRPQSADLESVFLGLNADDPSGA